MSAPVMERFWAKVDKREDGCWIWTAATTRGYGNFWDGERHIRAHRFAYEALVGPIPEGLTIDHLCRQTSCVNPEHMEPVTNEENILRGTSVPAENARKTHCKRGHELSPENTRITRSGFRNCIRCHREQQREKRAARRALLAGRTVPQLIADYERVVGERDAEKKRADAANHAGLILIEDVRAAVRAGGEAAEALRRIVELPRARPTGYDSDGAMGVAPVSISEAQAIARAALSHSPEAVQAGDDAA